MGGFLISEKISRVDARIKWWTPINHLTKFQGEHLGQSIQGWTKQNIWKTTFKKFEGIWSAKADHITFSFFKGCLPQILLSPLLNTMVC